MTLEAEKCEACRRNVVEVIVEDDDPIQPYRVCAACARRLRQYALRPLEWFNLTARHGPSRFLLHDDFYFDNGEAGQPEEDVEEPEKYPAPTLEQVQHDRERLLDYAITLYRLDAPMITALARHGKADLLTALQRRVAAQPNVDIELTTYAICTDVLGRSAETWIRERWAEWKPQTFLALAYASAACLPADEGYGRVTSVLENPTTRARLQQDRYAWSSACDARVPFHSPKTLGWIEAHVELTTKSAWGNIAAQSHFSWPRAVRWLERGRPFSLIALFALRECYRTDKTPEQKYQPVLEEPAPIEDMVQTLTAFYESDAVPNVRNLVHGIQQAIIQVDTPGDA